jgi:sphingolipid delta-4 desaturase
MLAGHELSHDYWLPKRWQNELLAICCNLPAGVASAVTFRRYHTEHHTYQGDDEKDADLPTEFEGRFFTTWYLKLLWVFLQPLFYALRPIITKPKPVLPMEILNWACVVAVNILVIHNWGVKAFFYLLGGQLLGLGLHPMAGHFIAEHFEFISGQETYSYYGCLNFFGYNVGYHNEHHDFPKVPGRLLPEVRRIAPEFYDTLPYYNSWSAVLYGFIFGQNINCFCRVKRTDEKKAK